MTRISWVKLIFCNKLYMFSSIKNKVRVLICKLFSRVICQTLQDSLEREVSVMNSRSKELKLEVTGDFYTEVEMDTKLKLDPNLSGEKHSLLYKF